MDRVILWLACPIYRPVVVGASLQLHLVSSLHVLEGTHWTGVTTLCMMPLEGVTQEVPEKAVLVNLGEVSV